MSTPNRQPAVSVSAVVAAGLASATAAVITSRFGVAGTLIGAALTTMIITGGSAILRAYLESMSGRVRRVPGKVRSRSSRIKESLARPRLPRSGETLPGRSDLRNNFVGRVRAALDWFRNLSPLRRRSIIVGTLVPAVVAFLIAMGAITGVELVAGKSLNCLWSDCAAESAGTGASTPRTTMGSFLGASGAGDPAVQEQFQDQQPVDPQQADPQQNAQPVVPDPSGQPSEEPAAPADPGSQAPVEPAPVEPAPEQPAPAETPSAEPTPEPADPSAAPEQ